MSDRFVINANTLKAVDKRTQVCPKNSTNKDGLSVIKADNDSLACSINISKETMMKINNQKVNASIENQEEIRNKRKLLIGTGSVAYKVNEHVAHQRCWQDQLEMLRLDEPETYAEVKRLFQKAVDAFSETGEITEESLEYDIQGLDLMDDWFIRRCFKNGELYNPITGQSAVIKTLEEIYPDTSFNFYSNEYSGRESSLWRYDTKFNVLLSIDMINKLAMVNNMDDMTEEDKEARMDILERIGTSVNEMRDVADKYDGDLEYLRFGVQLWDDGSVTYHANYASCDKMDGIMADSAEELLEMLKSQG